MQQAAIALPLDYFTSHRSKKKSLSNNRYKLAKKEDIAKLKSRYANEEETKNSLLKSLNISPNENVSAKIENRFKNLTDTEFSVQKKLHSIRLKKLGIRPFQRFRGMARVLFGFLVLFSAAKKKPRSMTEEQRKELEDNIGLCAEMIRKWLIKAAKEVIASVFHLKEGSACMIQSSV
eukprot:TRINITY_DN12183_c0_g3_i1.p1 TRINITY_DN12183_c0_g3~~TRINITY_DN12183_c0_g3_i1.p1  ORF type:complete len:177 (-),score=43.69 TRINITY_DN12183_c0_g3_i1:4-534(-)